MHVRIWEFLTGGGGGPGPSAKNSLDNFLFITLVPSVFYNLQKGSNNLLWGNLYFSKD